MTRTVTQIARDSFARQDTVRVLVTPEDRHSCDGCGSAPGKFAYGTWPDDKPRPHVDDSHAFCSISCWRAYH